MRPPRVMEGSKGGQFALLRPATAGLSIHAGIVAFGPFRLDSTRRVLTARGQEVALQPRAFDLLELFVACRGQS